MIFKRKKTYVSQKPVDFSSVVLFIKIKIKNLSIINLPRFNKFFIFDIADSHAIHYGTPTSSASMVVIVNHAVFSLLFLVSCFIFASFLLIFLECEFLALIFIINNDGRK